MTTPHNPDRLDALVRAHLDREAAAVDARAMLARVRPVSPRTPTRRRWLAVAGVGAGLAVAAGIGLFLVGGPPVERTALASAAEVVREAKSVQEAAPTDRQYAVSAEWEVTPFQKRFPFRPISREATVWTRGDQFVVQSKFVDGGEWAWGQDAGGRVWIAPTRKRVLVFEADELAEPLTRFCELMSLRLASTLGELLEKHELARRDGGRPGEEIHIAARARTPAPGGVIRLDNVELFLDPTTKVVRRAVLAKQLNGETVGRVEFTLADTAAKPDEFYTPRGHTDADALTLDRKPGPPPKFDLRLRFRDELLKRFAPRDK